MLKSRSNSEIGLSVLYFLSHTDKTRFKNVKQPQFSIGALSCIHVVLICMESRLYFESCSRKGNNLNDFQDFQFPLLDDKASKLGAV